MFSFETVEKVAPRQWQGLEGPLIGKEVMSRWLAQLWPELDSSWPDTWYASLLESGHSSAPETKPHSPSLTSAI